MTCHRLASIAVGFVFLITGCSGSTDDSSATNKGSTPGENNNRPAAMPTHGEDAENTAKIESPSIVEVVNNFDNFKGQRVRWLGRGLRGGFESGTIDLPIVVVERGYWADVSLAAPLPNPIPADAQFWIEGTVEMTSKMSFSSPEGLPNGGAHFVTITNAVIEIASTNSSALENESADEVRTEPSDHAELPAGNPTIEQCIQESPKHAGTTVNWTGTVLSSGNNKYSSNSDTEYKVEVLVSKAGNVSYKVSYFASAAPEPPLAAGDTVVVTGKVPERFVRMFITNGPTEYSYALDDATITCTEKAPSTDDFKIWTDSTGEFKVKAKFISLADGKAKLQKENGVVIEVPLERLSPDDQAFVKIETDAGESHTDVAEEARTVSWQEDFELYVEHCNAELKKAMDRNQGSVFNNDLDTIYAGKTVNWMLTFQSIKSANDGPTLEFDGVRRTLTEGGLMVPLAEFHPGHPPDWDKRLAGSVVSITGRIQRVRVGMVTDNISGEKVPWAIAIVQDVKVADNE